MCVFTVAMLPSPCFLAHFQVLHQEQVMEKANLKKTPSYFAKKGFRLASGGSCLMHKKKCHVTNPA